MRLRSKILLALVAVSAGAGIAAYNLGYDARAVIALVSDRVNEQAVSSTDSQSGDSLTAAPAITVAKAERRAMIETLVVTGTIVPREEILVSPEVEGIRIVDIKVDVGDRVKRGDTLAVLERTQLDAQLAQNYAALARAQATIAQAHSTIKETAAAEVEAKAAFNRAIPLKKSGHISQSVYDQREAAARTSAARHVAARNGLKLAEANKQEIEARRREISWQLSNTEVKAPRSGIISRRTARIGSLATGAATPMFNIIANGEIELEAQVIEADLHRIKPGQTAQVETAGVKEIAARVRLVSPEVDRASRLGTAKIFIGDRTDVRIGAFARAGVVTGQSRDIAIPASSVLYKANTAQVLVVRGGRVEGRTVTTGLRSGEYIEILSGLTDGELVVAKAGTFLRDGDRVRAVLPDTKVSEAQ
ncbi:MAG: efflux RND transporter periplasmic adaptor subunit [Hyphomicrobiaceae bacterium]